MKTLFRFSALLKLHFAIMVCWSGASTTFGAVAIIDANTRNGSFESGVLTPWLGDLQVVHDPAFAHHGNWYGIVEGMPPTDVGAAREIAFQYFQTDPNDGRTFIATFDARTGTTGFSSLSVDLFARGSSGTFIGATELPLAFPALSSSEWRTYQVQYELPDTWNGDGQVSLQIRFSESEAVNGTTYVGYLDNITLQAVPEPSILTLLGIGGLFVVPMLRSFLNRTVDHHRPKFTS